VLVDTPGIGENEFLENYLMDYIRHHQILGFMYVIMTDNALGIAEDRVSCKQYKTVITAAVTLTSCITNVFIITLLVIIVNIIVAIATSSPS